MIDQRTTDIDLRWRASPLALALATCAAVALAAALIGARWQPVVFAAPLLGALVSLGWQRPSPTVRVHAEPGLVRCFEGEQVRLALWATADDGTPVGLTFSTAAGASIDVAGDPSGRIELVLSAERWGRYPITVRVDVVARGGLLAGRAVLGYPVVADVFVFPVAPAQSTALPRTELLDRLGTHMTRHVGRGVEYGGIRAYVPGDQLRTVNWPVSARRGGLHVTERLSERAADVIVVVDTYDQPPGPATQATERTVRGAVQVVQSALRNGDRAGVVALGGQPRWMGADIGRRQFYRVLDAILGAGDGHETTTGTLVPRAAIPPGAVVVAFSTLLDTDFALALIDLCRRGHVVVAVDVLDGAPFDDLDDPLIARMWSMQRAFMYRDMRTIGVDIVLWSNEASSTDGPLDQVMQLVPRRRRAAARR
ncbi:DUF58 domain-containing protein [Mycolicibacterium hodleri]|uniref:DUF58 domain-containing protein n=1 Tax=Mycolicibacterium hodleri TaxID=49897 RepID=A0A502EDX2_9MYCO|nr:DUF58 domain-containing protein [Mycolicibacterium hodleri]TPG35209.1 DUF58 domain-containing protein [Mycolicibacterium hodleri]